MPGANLTSFQMLDIYLDAMMQWDTTRDVNELTQKWFKAMFKEAADVMFDLYLQQNNWALIIAHETKKIAQTGIINYSIGREYWKYEMLKGWLDKIDEARALVEKYKKTASDAVGRYITMRATTLGVTANEIKNRLSENYTLDEVDEVCESLRNYKRNMSKLSFSLHENMPVGSKVVVREDTAAHLAANPDDVIDQSLYNLLNT
jgi:CRISPR/Cas system CSM-associated protein Csm2 small subunit